MGGDEGAATMGEVGISNRLFSYVFSNSLKDKTRHFLK